MTDADTGDDRPGDAPSAADAIEVNEPDLIEQHVAVAADDGPDPARRVITDDPEVPEADALEQSIPVARDADDY